MRACLLSLLKNSELTTTPSTTLRRLANLNTRLACVPAITQHGFPNARQLLGKRSTATAARRHRRRRENESAFRTTGLVGHSTDARQFEWLTPAKRRTKAPEDSKHKVEAWVELLEQFLPAELRSSDFKDITYRSEEDPSADRQLLVTILHDARLPEHGNLDILAYIGLIDHRWKAVMWLAEYLLDEVNLSSTSKEISPPSNIIWPNPAGNASLRELCSGPINISDSNVQTENRFFDVTANLHVDRGSNSEAQKDRSNSIMREIWQSMGTITIEATSMAPDDMRSVMGWLYQIIAQLHHRGLMPKAIYQYQAKDNTSTTTRSPVIYLLSTRLLSALSDTVFTKESREIPGMAYRIVGSDPYPNVWLEYILWCCIDSGFIEESSWILAQLQSSRFRQDWRLVDWTSFQQTTVSKSGWFSGPRTNDIRQELLETTESRTISSQIIVATIDGLINYFRRFDDPGETLRQPFLQRRIFHLLSFLGEQAETAPSLTVLNRLLLRMRETPGFMLQLFPGSVWHIVRDMQDTGTVEPQKPPSTPLEAFALPLQFETIMQNIDPVFSTLHQTLEQFSRLGDVRRALSTFDTIQFFVDRSRRRTIDLFAQRLRSSEDRNTTSDDAAEEGYFLPQGQPSSRILGRFLDVLTLAGRFDFGRWLLYSADPDGPIINPVQYGVPQLSPALIRFAQATNDAQLLSQVVQASPSNVSIAFLYSLLSARFWFHQFDLAEDILALLRDTEEGTKGEIAGYRIGSVASLTAVTIRLEREAQSSEDAGTKLHMAISLCERILQGEFSNFFNYGRDFQAYRESLNVCFIRILQSFPNPCQGLATRLMPRFEFQSQNALPPQAFNILISVVTESRGAIAGKDLYDQFCKEPEDPAIDRPQTENISRTVLEGMASEDPSAEEWWISYTQPVWNEPIRRGHRIVNKDRIPFEDAEAHVGERKPLAKPDIWTVRMVVKAALREIRLTDLSAGKSQEIQSILEWSIGVFKKFGLKISDIVHELGPESMRRDFLPRKKIAAILYGR